MAVQDVEPPVVGDGALDQAGERGIVGDVCGNAFRRAQALGADRPDAAASLRSGERSAMTTRAPSRAMARVPGEADAGARPGDDGDAVLEDDGRASGCVMRA